MINYDDLKDRLIVVCADLLDIGVPIADLHSALKNKGWSEEDIYFAFIAGKLLLKQRKISEQENLKQKSFFRRIF